MNDEQVVEAMLLGPDGEDYAVARQSLAALRAAGFDVVELGPLRTAILDAGPQPAYHAQVMARHRREWPTLWTAIDVLVGGDS